MRYAIPDKQADAWRAIISTAGYKRRMAAKRLNKGLQIYPTIYSDDSRFLAVMRKTAHNLSSIKVTVDKSGVLGPEAVPGDANALLTTAGYGMNPISVPPVSNAEIRKKLSLADGFVTERTSAYSRTCRSSCLLAQHQLPSAFAAKRVLVHRIM